MAVACKRFKKAIKKITKKGFYFDCFSYSVEEVFSNYQPYQKHLEKCKNCKDLLEKTFDKIHF